MTDPGSPLTDFIRTIAMLSGILLLAWVGLRKWLPKLGAARGTRTGLIEVVSRQVLEPRRTLYVVRAGKEHFLLASSDQGIALLRQLDVAPETAQEPAHEPSFAGLLRRCQGGTA